MAIAAGLALVLVIAMASRGTTHREISGTFTIYTSDFTSAQLGQSCRGANVSYGYADIEDGTNVIVEDGGGEVIGTGELSGGVVDPLGCKFDWEVTDLPDTSSYSITVSHRGALHYTRSELEDHDWVVSITLGND
ncbi:MAG: hypothetical protein LC640_01960 [Frankia sp.]|nr:hypothetical protein [Frankia sp.]